MTEFIDGIKVSDVGRLKENNFSLDDIDRKLFNAFAEQIFHTGFVHADPHPGNGNTMLDFAVESLSQVEKSGHDLD